MKNLFNRQTNDECIKKTKVIKELKIKKDVQKYKIWSIDAYKYCGKEFISNKFVELELNELLNALEMDNGYHMRIISNNNYIFYGDCDGFKSFQKNKKSDTFEEFAELLISFLSKHYQIELDVNDISYTSNESKPGYHHYSVPKLYGSTKKLTEIHEYFQKYDKRFIYTENETEGKQKKNKVQKVVDSGVYTTKWFRYPNQIKENIPGTEHVIKRGKMIDFVVEYVPEYSICINDKKYTDIVKKDTKKNLSIENLSVFTQSELEQYNEMSAKNQVNDDTNYHDIGCGDSNCDNSDNSDYDDSYCDNKNQSISVHDIENINDIIKEIESFDEMDGDNKDEDEESNRKYQKDTNKIKKYEDEYDDIGYIDTSNFSQEYKKQLINDILKNIDTYDSTRKEWLAVGMAIKNESVNEDQNDFFNLWHNWSKKSKTKYNGYDDCKNEWENIECRKFGRRYTIQYLIDELKKKNQNLSSELERKNQMCNLLKKNMHYFPHNNCTIQDVECGSKSCNITLDDDFCPIHNGEHLEDNICYDEDKSRRLFIATIKNTAYVQCTHQNCAGKFCPKNGILLNKSTMNNIFMSSIGNINYVVNNNYGENKWLFPIHNAFEDEIVYEDPKLNKIMLESLKGGQYLANAIIHVLSNKLMSVNDEWYYFESRWKKYQNIDNIICRDFFALYNVMREKINVLSDTTDNQRRGYNEQLDTLIEDFTNDKKNKKVFLWIKSKTEKNTSFDTNGNLFAFNNGVYDFALMKFRNIVPDDMITMTSGYNYIDDYVDKQALVHTLTTLFPNKETLECFLTFLALNIRCKFNLNMLLILQWFKNNIAQNEKMRILLGSLFGDYCSTFNDFNLDDILSNTEEHVFGKIRLLIIKSMNQYNQKDVLQLTVTKMISGKDTKKLKIKQIPVHFSTLCICDNEPHIDPLIQKNIGHIRMTDSSEMDQNIDDTIINTNDLFLLLIEHISNFTNYDIFAHIKYVKIQDHKNMETEKYCKLFENEFIGRASASYYTKSADVYKAYLNWCNNNEYPNLSKPKFFSYFKTKYRFEISVRISGSSTSGFNLQLKKINK